MNRKNVILATALINAGLLSILLIAALVTQEEAVPSSISIGDASSVLPKFEEAPLFGEAPDSLLKKGALAVQEPLPDALSSQPLADKPQMAPEPMASPKEEPLMHKLPPLVPEMPVAAPSSLPQRVEPAYAEVAVKKGDSLEKIAKSHRTTVDELLKLNQLPSSFLRVGQVLKVPAERAMVSASKTRPAAAEKAAALKGSGGSGELASPEYYTVKVGDNPWTIAMKHHMKVDELLRLNGLNEEKARKLKPGDRLRTR